MAEDKSQTQHPSQEPGASRKVRTAVLASIVIILLAGLIYVVVVPLNGLAYLMSLPLTVKVIAYLVSLSLAIKVIAISTLFLFLMVALYHCLPRRCRLRFWLALFGLGILFYVGSLVYRADAPARAQRHRAWVTPEFPGSQGKAILAISYPQVVPLEAEGEPGSALSAYLWPKPVPATTPQPTTQSSSTAVPHPSEAVSYTVAFEPYDQGVLFTDEKGVPVPPQVRVSPGQSSGQADVLYLRRAPLATAPLTTEVNVTVRDPDGALLSASTPITFIVDIESEEQAQRRRFLDLLFSPTTPLLALAGLLAPFVLEEWKRGQEERKERREIDETVRDVIGWVAQGRLDEIDRELDALREQYGEDLKVYVRRRCQDVRRAQMRRVREVLAPTDPLEAQRHLDHLREVSKKERWPKVFPSLAGELDQTAQAARRQQIVPWLQLWAQARFEHPTTRAWCQARGLAFDPFGPEKAEDDPLLARFFVEQAEWEAITAAEPTAVYGVDGSGRTASCLYLAHRCMTTGLPLDRAEAHGTFPVYLTLSPGQMASAEPAAWWEELAWAVAAGWVDFLACNPWVFAQAEPRQRMALAHLLLLHYGDRLGVLSDRLSSQRPAAARLGPEAAVHLTERIRQSAREAKPTRPTGPEEWCRLIGRARLAPFRRIYILISMAEERSTKDQHEQVVSCLRSVEPMAQDLANWDVYLKLFLPLDREDHPDLPSRVSSVVLTWDEKSLRRVLERRVEQAAGPETPLAALFGELPSGVDPEGLLIQAAMAEEGTPRRLVQIGEKALLKSIPKPPEGGKPLKWEDFKRVLDRFLQEGEEGS